MADIDNANPLDSALISGFPGNERASRTAIETIIEVEHDGAGGSATGRHKFGRGSTGTRDAITNWETGSLWVSTSVTPNILTMNVGTGASPTWVNVVPASGALDNIVEDLTPQLGGSLDVNGNTINFPSVNLTDMLDQDDLSSNSATAGVTQQSVKAYIDAQIAAQTLPSPDFTSSEITVTADKVEAIAHGLGSIPTLVQWILRCKTGNLGYTAGDEVLYNAAGSNFGSTDQGITAFSDATNCTIVQGASIPLINFSTFNGANITVGSWRWIVRVWA